MPHEHQIAIMDSQSTMINHLTSQPTQVYVPLHGPVVVHIPPDLHFFLASDFDYNHEMCTRENLTMIFKAFYPDSYIGIEVTKEYIRPYFEDLVMYLIQKHRTNFNYETNTMKTK